MSRAPEDAMREIAGKRRADAIATADAAMRKYVAGEERRTGPRRTNATPYIHPDCCIGQCERTCRLERRIGRSDGYGPMSPTDRRSKPAAVQHYADMAEHARALARVAELEEILARALAGCLSIPGPMGDDPDNPFPQRYVEPWAADARAALRGEP